MNTQKLKKMKPILILVLALSSFMIGCTKKCLISKEKIPSIVSTPLRLVQSTDPDPEIQNNLSNFTFLIFTFAQNFTGDVKLVLNNVQFDNPVKTFSYNIDPRTKQLLIKYADATASDTADATSGSATGGNEPILYSYQLGRALELNSEENYYRFVPFTGVLNPDDTCTF